MPGGTVPADDERVCAVPHRELLVVCGRRRLVHSVLRGQDHRHDRLHLPVRLQYVSRRERPPAAVFTLVTRGRYLIFF